MRALIALVDGGTKLLDRRRKKFRHYASFMNDRRKK